MLLMVAHGRGVAALPRWLVEENVGNFDVKPVRLGRDGIAKQIFLGLRENDAEIDYMRAFIDLASTHRPARFCSLLILAAHPSVELSENWMNCVNRQTPLAKGFWLRLMTSN